MYKFQLDKSSKKFQCPKCQKKTFVKYEISETKEYLDYQFGRCDRESKCGYHLSPKGNKPLVTNEKLLITETPSFHSLPCVDQSYNNHESNNLIQYLLRNFDRVDVEATIKQYLIGTSTKWPGSTVFWQIDQYENVHAGKIMLYDRTTGKRVKIPYPHITWQHKHTNLENFNLQQCLFGLHNLNESQIKTIGIAESEKTAITMSIMRPDMTWMATGAKTNFKTSFLEPLKGRKIIAFPDNTEFKDWDLKAKQMREQGLNIICSDFLEHQNLEEGDDLVDLLL